MELLLMVFFMFANDIHIIVNCIFTPD